MKTKKIATAAAALATLLTLAAGSCQSTGGDFDPVELEQSDGDCDEGDKYESKPDPDCHGIWYGTPTPAARKTTAPVRKPTTRRT